MDSAPSRPMLPLVAICGTTGVGKSQLAVELALRLAARAAPGRWRGARVVNADAMQVYAGADVLTNKLSLPARRGVEHCLLGVRAPGSQYVVGEWVRDAVREINETHARGQLPIVVGGTAYWMQHLLFPDRLTSVPEPDSSGSDLAPSPALEKAVAALPEPLAQLYGRLPDLPLPEAEDLDGTLALHQLLSALDPAVAERWHWKDARKVLRSLTIIRENGRLNSEIIAEQSQAVILPRYRTLCLWLYADPQAFHPRLDARVDDMMRQGLLKEVEELDTLARQSVSCSSADVEETASSNSQTDYTLGLYQSIGFREFEPYLRCAEKLSPEAAELVARGVEGTKVATRQYAKRQVSWIRNKLLPAVRAVNEVNRRDSTDDAHDVLPTYLLDATELGDSWNSQVMEPAGSILDAFLEEEPLPQPSALSPRAASILATAANKPVDPSSVLAAQKKIVCDVCTADPARPVMIETGAAWDVHRRTKTHRRRAAHATRELHPLDKRRNAASTGVAIDVTHVDRKTLTPDDAGQLEERTSLL